MIRPEGKRQAPLTLSGSLPDWNIVYLLAPGIFREVRRTALFVGSCSAPLPARLPRADDRHGMASGWNSALGWKVQSKQSRVFSTGSPLRLREVGDAPFALPLVCAF